MDLSPKWPTIRPEWIERVRRALQDREFAPKQTERNLSEIYLGLGSSTLRYNERGLLSVCSKPSYVPDPKTVKRWPKVPNSTAKLDFSLLATPQWRAGSNSSIGLPSGSSI
jgi:hypothetical protein